MEISPVNFTQRSNIPQINRELIKAGYWIVEEDGRYFMYERKRGKELGKLHRAKSVRKEIIEYSNLVVNRYFREKGWIK